MSAASRFEGPSGFRGERSMSTHFEWTTPSEQKVNGPNGQERCWAKRSMAHSISCRLVSAVLAGGLTRGSDQCPCGAQSTASYPRR